MERYGKNAGPSAISRFSRRKNPLGTMPRNPPLAAKETNA